MKNHKYMILPEPLHSVADATIDYFIKRRGVPTSSVKIEQAIETEPPLPFRPTFTAKTTDHHILCVDVAESAYNNSLDAFVLNCMHQGLPVKLFIAIPNGRKDPDYAQKLATAKSRGVGILEISNHSVNVVREALALSLAGFRPIPVQEFPSKLRENLNRAETVFREGSPDKACSLIYDELESLCRAAGRKTYDSGCWKASVKFNFDRDAWGKLMQLLAEHLDAKKSKCPKLTSAFLARIHGITPHRNDTGHKPKNAEELKKRERELRTRFETAVDLLRDLVVAVKPLRLI